jgi:transposase
VEYALTAQQWRRIKGFLPGKASDCGVTAKDNRLFVEAVLWMARNGARWRALPKAYGDWHSVYVRFARWAKAGIWNRLFEALSADADFVGFLLIVPLLSVTRFIPENRTYIVGWEVDPPDQIATNTGEPTGFAVELVREGARRSGIRLKWVKHRESSEAALRSKAVVLRKNFVRDKIALP